MTKAPLSQYDTIVSLMESHDCSSVRAASAVIGATVDALIAHYGFPSSATAERGTALLLAGLVLSVHAPTLAGALLEEYAIEAPDVVRDLVNIVAQTDEAWQELR